ADVDFYITYVCTSRLCRHCNPLLSSPSGFPLDEAELGPDRYDIRLGEKEGVPSTLTFNTDYF
ncbi:MAG: hypothetical protein ACE3JR_03760, partial [Ectobacillus sp.]